MRDFIEISKDRLLNLARVAAVENMQGLIRLYAQYGGSSLYLSYNCGAALRKVLVERNDETPKWVWLHDEFQFHDVLIHVESILCIRKGYLREKDGRMKVCWRIGFMPDSNIEYCGNPYEISDEERGRFDSLVWGCERLELNGDDLVKIRELVKPEEIKFDPGVRYCSEDEANQDDTCSFEPLT